MGAKEATMSMNKPSRRLILTGGLAAGGLGLTGVPGLGEELPVTPACDDRDDPTLPQIEGPFYKPRSPERVDLSEPEPRARIVELTGFVLTRGCRPVSRALLDLWHADETGEYDNSGFRYRGHVFTDDAGRYRFRTIMPAAYPGRTRHYHVKVLSTGRALLTTQLYFPDDPGNRRDMLYSRELTMRMGESRDALAARFDFVLNLT
jgi:protocatechuate 3,4-dioxygenase beta subunit